jgi:hypothetical protein
MQVNKGLILQVLLLIHKQRSLKNVVQTLPRLFVVKAKSIPTIELAHVMLDHTEFGLN